MLFNPLLLLKEYLLPTCIFTYAFNRASEGTLSPSRLLLQQSIAPSDPHWARVVGYGPFSLCVIQKRGLCPSSGDINRLMMMFITLTLSSLRGRSYTFTCYLFYQTLPLYVSCVVCRMSDVIKGD
jgi:hypothetical protein